MIKSKAAMTITIKEKINELVTGRDEEKQI